MRDGFEGLADDRFVSLTPKAVASIAHLAGSTLGCTRCASFARPAAQQQALRYLQRLKIDAAIVLGGDGALKAAGDLEKLGLPTLGLVATINNDVSVTDLSIGFDTAANNALRLIDGLRPTARATQRAFLVEVMGGKCGYLALAVGLAAGAEVVITPEYPATADSIAQRLTQAYRGVLPYALIIVAEGARQNVDEIASEFATHKLLTGFETRVLRLGHLLRGGAPTALDRLLGAKLGCAAVDLLERNEHNLVLALRRGVLEPVPLSEVEAAGRRPDGRLVELARALQQSGWTYAALPIWRAASSVGVRRETAAGESTQKTLSPQPEARGTAESRQE